MHLLLIRHADAGEHDPSRWPDDTLRPMTDAGAKRHKRVARRLRRRKVAPTLLLASPWPRAWPAVRRRRLPRSPAPVLREVTSLSATSRSSWWSRAR